MEQGVAELINLIRSKELLPEIERVAQEVSSLVPGYELNPDILEKASRPVSMKTSTGLSQLNPVYEASIAERAFLDGDVPELRSGPLPEGGTPAVPVKTDSLDPVTIGLLLDIASKKVQRQLERQRDEFVLHGFDRGLNVLTYIKYIIFKSYSQQDKYFTVVFRIM